MTGFDAVVLILVGVSALVGFIRGGVREVVTVAALAIAALVAIFSLRLTAPLARAAIDPDWAGTGVALVVVFIVVYIAVRVFAASLTRRIQTSALGPVDRAAGAGFGVIRALVVLGVFHLVFHAITPRDRLPTWITGAAAYPVTLATASALRVVAREGSGQVNAFRPAIEQAVREGAEPTPEEQRRPDPADPAYDRSERRNMDALVEDRAR